MDHRIAQYFLCVALLLFAIPEKPASAAAQCSGKTQGKHFIIGFTDTVVDFESTRQLSILIASLSDQPTTVNISSNLQIDGSPFKEEMLLQSRASQQINIPLDFTMNGTERSLKALEIVASNEISVFGFLNQKWTTDGFLGIPVSSLGQQYVVVTAKPSFGSQFAVIGTEESTSVQVILSGAVSFEGQTYYAGDFLNFTVNRLEAVHIQGQDSSQDLTGSVIQTDKPVAAFSGNEFAKNSGKYCDTLTEQLVPVMSWGKEHIYTAARSDDANIYRIVAYFNGTTLDVPGYEEILLEPREFWQGSLNGTGLISSSQPILVMQQLASINNTTVDPSLTHVPAVEHFGYEFGFVTPAKAGDNPIGFFNYINIVVKTDSRSTLTLNGSPIDGTGVNESPVPYTDYTSITVELPKGEGSFFVEQADPLSSPFTVVVYGYEYLMSYGYAAGLVLPSNKQLVNSFPYILRELGGEVVTITIPCLQTNASSTVDAQITFSTDLGNVLVLGERFDSYTVACVTPTFLKNGLTSVYVSADDGETFPYSGIVYSASEETLPPLLKIQQANSEYGEGAIDTTSEDPIVFSWDPGSLGEGVSHLNVSIQDSDEDSNGNLILREGVPVKNYVLNNGSLTIYPSDIRSISGNNVSLSAICLTSYAMRKLALIPFARRAWRVYKLVKIITFASCSLSIKEFKKSKPVTGLPPCPCCTKQAKKSNFKAKEAKAYINLGLVNIELHFDVILTNFFHNGADVCYRLAPLNREEGQQCCYGKNGKLRVGLEEWGGTADRYNQNSFGKHQLHDVVPFICLCKREKRCKEYYEKRPSDDCTGYKSKIECPKCPNITNSTNSTDSTNSTYSISTEGPTSLYSGLTTLGTTESIDISASAEVSNNPDSQGTTIPNIPGSTNSSLPSTTESTHITGRTISSQHPGTTSWPNNAETTKRLNNPGTTSSPNIPVSTNSPNLPVSTESMSITESIERPNDVGSTNSPNTPGSPKNTQGPPRKPCKPRYRKTTHTPEM